MQQLAGKLIAIEGIDQAGKQTVCQWLAETLRANGVPAEQTGFPDYSTPLGQEITAFLSGQRAYPAEARQLLYAANRWERAAELRSWLAAGTAIVVDRYSASGIAYGAAQGLDMAWMREVERGLPPADLTILLDIAPEVSLARKTTARDAYETRLDLLAAARAAYHTLAQAPGWLVVDAAADRDTVRERVLAALQQHLAA
ncbi:MAG: dTMP kinase [Chloroflexi bacterium]|nr:dTMP kinase [Chloroflexota bacterium]